MKNFPVSHLRIIGALLCCLAGSLTSSSQATIKIYVSRSGSDSNKGTSDSPFATVGAAKQYVRSLNTGNTRTENIQVIIRQGVYELAAPLDFSPEDGGDSLHSVTYMAQPGDRVVLSGGKALSGVWTKSDSKGLWKMELAGTPFSDVSFRALFADDHRVNRASSPTLLTKGPLPEYVGTYKTFDFSGIQRLAKDSIQAFCGFQYQNDELSGVKDVESADIIVYNSWEGCWASLKSIDPSKSIAYLKNPLSFPIGFFGPKMPYRVENSKDYLTQPDEWVLDFKRKELWYYAAVGQDPNKMHFTAPILGSLMAITGDPVNHSKSVQNLHFQGIVFSYSSSSWGKNKYSISQKDESLGLDASQGFSAGQGSFNCGEVVLLKGAKDCGFEGCSFSHLGNYGVRIGEFCAHDALENCTLSDIGGGGIIIGLDAPGGKHQNWPDDLSPSYNTVKNCKIFDCGVFFPGVVGIAVLQSSHNLIQDNLIYNLPYSGISVGWTWGLQDNYTTDNTIQGNKIHGVMTLLADGGGIYTLGKQPGTIFKHNNIYDIGRGSNAIGSSNNGFFFDQGSSGFMLDSNAVSAVKSQDYRFNQTDSTKIRWGQNYFEKKGTNAQILRGMHK